MRNLKDENSIVNAFAKMQSSEDLLTILNLAKVALYGEKAVPFSLRQLNFYSISQHKNIQYTQYSIPKKSGGVRIIHAPIKTLKHIQACLNYIFQLLHTPHEASYGFIPADPLLTMRISTLIKALYLT